MQKSRIETFRTITLPNPFPRLHDRPGLSIPRRRLSLLQLIGLIIAGLSLLPIVYLVIQALSTGQEGIDYLLRERTLEIMANSIVLMGVVTVSAVVVGVPFAWLTARTDLPLRRVWLVVGLLPMVIPSYLGAVTMIAAFGPRGILQTMLEPLGVNRLPSLYGLFGAALVITLATYPYVVLPVRAALLKMDPALEEAARSLGLRRRQVFWRVILPQLRPALAAGALLTALYTLSDFGAVAMMRYNAFTRAIYLQYTSSFNRDRAVILALALVVLTLFLLVMERRAAATHNFRIGTGTSRRPRQMRLRRWKVPALAFCTTLVGIGVFIPVMVLLSWLLTRTPSNALSMDIGMLTGSTIGVSSLTALVVAVVALPLAVLAARSVSRVNHWLANMTYLSYVLPGIVVALALVFFATNYALDLYQTFPLLILGYSTRYLAYSIGTTRSALTQINPRIEESARSLGLNQWQVIRRVTLPLAWTGVVAGGALVFLNVMKELPTTLILSPIGFRTFATRIWTAYTEGSMAQIAQPGLMLMLVSALLLLVILWRDKEISL